MIVAFACAEGEAAAVSPIRRMMAVMHYATPS